MPGRTLVLVAGLPGAGKSTLLATLARDADTVVLDSDAQRAILGGLLRRLPYPSYRPLVHLGHRMAVLVAVFSAVPTVVVHLPATTVGMRTAATRLARATGRVPHLIWLDVDAATARAAQTGRGRIVPSSSFARHVRAAAVPPDPRGWGSLTVADRASASGGLVLEHSAVAVDPEPPTRSAPSAAAAGLMPPASAAVPLPPASASVLPPPASASVTSAQ